MTDVPDENHDGSTQPLPIAGANDADTVPFDHVPIAEPATLPVALPPAPTMSAAPRRAWAPWLITALLGLATVVAAAVLLPPLLTPVAVSDPSPTPVASSSVSVTPIADDNGQPAPDPVQPPPPEPTPAPTVNPPDPTPVPTP